MMKDKNKLNYLIVSFLLFFCLSSIAQTRWQPTSDGGISWTVKDQDFHTDHIEMSGKQISVILNYGTDAQGNLVSDKQLIFPMLRMYPNNTHGHLSYTFGTDVSPIIKINNNPVTEKVKSFYIKGILQSVSGAGEQVSIIRTIFPSTDRPVAIEIVTLKNNGQNPVSVDVENMEKITRTHREKSVYDVYEVKAKTQNAGIYQLEPQKTISFSITYSGRRISSPEDTQINVDDELSKRQDFVNQMFNNIRFKSPDMTLNRMFDFAKIRAMESVFLTKGGLVHNPGGGHYYAAVWANDQAEYANPFFGYSGYDTAIESAMTSWRWFAKYMNPEYKPIPSSIVAEGDDYWNGAGDRGDQAMIAYGATRFALALGDKEKAKEIWPLIEWCLEYCKRKINEDGVVASDNDELENRFPAGKANLCTSALYYDALLSAVYLGKDLGIPQQQLNEYSRQAKEMHQTINRFFGANVQGFETYRYYKENDILRSWICVPLTTGIFERSKGTIDALFSPLLWTENGLLTQAGDKTFWDRSTLYGLRGAFAAGATEKAMPFFIDYSTRRLFGEHVPYAVEAWPEGNQRHLSAESALYCRVVTEGLFGFRPTGLNEFTITPQLPEMWETMSLENIVAFGNQSIDIRVDRIKNTLKTKVFVNGKLVKSYTGKKGETIKLRIKN